MNLKIHYYLYIFSVLIFFTKTCLSTVHGRYTREIENYELTLPHRITENGEFISFHLPQYFKHNYHRSKRNAPTEILYYNVIFNGKDHPIALWQNHGFISPNLVTEVYDGKTPVSERKLRRLKEDLCHYVGYIHGQKTYPVALSLCHGMTGYLMTDKGQYFIEPVSEHQPNSDGQHVHVIYKQMLPGKLASAPKCGTRENWTNAWTRNFREDIQKQSSKKNNMDMHNKRRYLELLLVVDKKFIKYHQNDDIETYILTLMNMVSNYYHDASIGSPVDVNVVRVIYLKKAMNVDLKITNSAEKTLDSFCDWSEGVNPADPDNPQHHDISVLMTRKDLCSDDDGDCDLMGLAYVATACNPHKSCAITEDSGLVLGITITHEVGHVMGCEHDDGQQAPCQPQNAAGEYYIMAPYGHMHTRQWSSCSRKFINELFDNRLGDCLYNVPQKSIYKANDMPPGAVYDADYQCNSIFPGSIHCILERSKICERLFCKMGKRAKSCTSKGEPPADGTKCAENKWCYNKQCVDMGHRPASVNGAWGKWSSWTECSRTCGGGVSISERECNNPVPKNKGKYCTGDSKRIKFCNTDKCPAGSVSYRDAQCAAYDNKPFQRRLYKWKSIFIADQPCELNCINERNIYSSLAPRVKDGTSCKAGTKHKCIFGECRKVGCDWVIDSDAVADMCGVCNGDGNRCKVVHEVYKKIGHGYTEVTVIPAKSTNIYINEKAATENTIAISSEDKKTFYLNGNYKEELDGEKDISGVPGIYDHPSTDKEYLYIAGPLPSAIILYVVFYKKENPGVEYKYAAPFNFNHIRKNEYYWEFVEFGDCSAECGYGVKISNPECMEKEHGKVGQQFCKEPKPDPKIVRCFIRPCQTAWLARFWSPCSGCKGQYGSRTREVDCVQESPLANKDPIIVETSKCVGPKPATKEVCYSDTPCSEAHNARTVYEKKLADLWQQWHDIKTRHENNKEKKFKILQSENNNDGYIEKRIIQPEIIGKKIENNIYFNKVRNYDATKKRECTKNPKVEEKIIADHIPEQERKLIVVPIKDNHEDMQLSDVAFESEGDHVVDNLDFCNAEIFTGKNADNEENRLVKENKERNKEAEDDDSDSNNIKNN